MNTTQTTQILKYLQRKKTKNKNKKKNETDTAQQKQRRQLILTESKNIFI